MRPLTSVTPDLYLLGVRPKCAPTILNDLDFFFSSRRRHTRLQGDWSSDVCSSDLGARRPRPAPPPSAPVGSAVAPARPDAARARPIGARPDGEARSIWSRASCDGEGGSEERRGGKEGRSRWWPDQ